MKIVFAGTPAFAVPSLAALVAAGHDVTTVYAQPDRPAGRGRKLTPGAVKQWALEHGIAVRQPEKLREAADELRALDPEVMIVVAYGQLLTAEILAIPRFGCLNVHASLLPRWRGAAPIARAIEAGDAQTGVTIMRMNEGLDTGPMLLRAATPILATETALALGERLAALGAESLVPALAAMAAGGWPEPQDDGLATYAKKLRKEEAVLDFSHPAEVLHRQIRAFNPAPGAVTGFRGARLKLWEVAPLSDAEASPGTLSGTVVSVTPEAIGIATGRGIVHITSLQPEGGRVLSARDFANGHRDLLGQRLGS